ncbi:type I 3-dehydroquinate dehydratase [Candidatus Enterococcus murrayae]|uniref:3-dehydroquinate dehydratase n=1 Tax=Candidatus Enterococcus murrayae TaxID=2815321 RepID=A0ABS3HPL4_9ENTE|nr:type I 3-dehydroquinate dehydratase [Enterococcus sp. MJM16]MBO0454533.1 type I 3-dehydroquinate dehydratase [Enterococcus sp. MJM16]
MKTVTIENVTLGEGQPKIIVPLVGKTRADVLQEAEIAVQSNCDIVEWRIDHFEEILDFNKTAEFSKEVKAAVGRPLLMTFRTAKEGGVCPLEDQKYFEMYHTLLENGAPDLLDVELFMPESEVSELVAKAHEAGKKIIMCNHDFDKTPSKEEIIRRLQLMQEKGADICKIAVMPQNAHDVIVLLDATQEMYHQHADRPLITMSMGELGVVSRVSGKTFGSAATFGAAKKASAPGQVSVAELRTVLETL